jgi:hypothetical protein
MKRVGGALSAAVLLVVFAGFAMAAGGSANASGGGSGTWSGDKTAATGQIQAGAGASAAAQDAIAPRTSARLKAIRARAVKMAANQREAIEKQLTAIRSDVDVEVFTNGEAEVADRLAAEFQVTSGELTSERAELDVSWGELMVAHTLMANSGDQVTLDQLFTLHSGGLGWGQIAYGLGLRGTSFASAVRAEALVARGQMESDGKPARVESGTYMSSSAGAGPVSGAAQVGGAGSVTVGPITRITR